jgi:hypothetical protein
LAQTVFARTDEQQLYRSTNEGADWNNENSKLQNSDVTRPPLNRAGISQIVPTANQDQVGCDFVCVGIVLNAY